MRTGLGELGSGMDTTEASARKLIGARCKIRIAVVGYQQKL